MKRDPSIAAKLLKSSNSGIWTKALNIAPLEVVLSLLPEVSKSKRDCFIRKLRSKTSYTKLIMWLAGKDMPKIPDDVWLERSNGESYADDWNNQEDEDYDEDEL